MTEPTPDYEFDVAVSFAGEDRDYVEEIVAPLRAAAVRVFYDSDFLAEIWGEDLVEFFDGIYRRRSRYAMMFISRHYAEKMWPRLERRSALARAMQQRAAYVLPIRLDDAEIEGLLPTVGVIDARRHGIEGIVQATLRKIASGPVARPSAIIRVPRTEAERQLVLLDKPPGWEYLYFAGELLHARDAIEHKYRDHDVRYAASNGKFVGPAEIDAFISQARSEAERLGSTLALVMNPRVQERAFGAPGEPGDAERILHLAERCNSIYEGFIDWAAQLRGAAVRRNYRNMVELLARIADTPITNYRKFVDDVVEKADELPAALAAAQPLQQPALSIVLDLPEDVLEAFLSEAQRLAAEGSMRPLPD